jgi:hypothetical protein
LTDKKIEELNKIRQQLGHDPEDIRLGVMNTRDALEVSRYRITEAQKQNPKATGKE